MSGEATLLDWSLHGGQWSIENGEILFDVSPIKGSRDAEQLLVPHGAFRCAYALSGDALSLSNCPYAGDYAAFRSRRGRR
jgi:hypothetical protein